MFIIKQSIEIIEKIKRISMTERFQFKLGLMYAIKLFYQKLLLPKPEKQNILLIVGCQRSGTSLMNRIFTQDLQVSVYRESSVLSSDDNGSPDDPTKLLRLNSSDQLARCFSQNKAPFIVLKPLVESQNILQLLADFPQAKALWMYRNYQDVTKSLVKRFQPSGEISTGVRDLRYIVQGNNYNWRSQNTSESVRFTVIKYFSEDMNAYDASALFWWVRNQLFLELNLSENSRVSLCRYEDLVTKPEEVMSKIYRFVGAPYNLNPKFAQDIDRNSLGKGSSIQLSPEIKQLCDQLLEQLDSYYGVANLSNDVQNFTVRKAAFE
jgi:hypothetical protein